MVNDGSAAEFSFSRWYPLFKKDSLKATVLHIPNEVLDYLEHDAFILPTEAANLSMKNHEWADGAPVTDEEKDSTGPLPTFPEFSRKIQDVLDEYGAVFLKSNWSSPVDATWVMPTKTMKCKTLEEIYLLLKSSDRIAKDLSSVKSHRDNDIPLEPCVVLKQWYNINPCTEYRCFVIDNELVAISQRDISQYHSYNESEKYNIQTDIKSLFTERVKERFPLSEYCVDVVRYKKDRVKIVDFGPLDQSSTKGTLFTYQELRSRATEPTEFRFIGEEIGIQPKPANHICVPREIDEFFRSNGSSSSSLLDIIQREVDSQRMEAEHPGTDTTENV